MLCAPPKQHLQPQQPTVVQWLQPIQQSRQTVLHAARILHLIIRDVACLPDLAQTRVLQLHVYRPAGDSRNLRWAILPPQAIVEHPKPVVLCRLFHIYIVDYRERGYYRCCTRLLLHSKANGARSISRPTRGILGTQRRPTQLRKCGPIISNHNVRTTITHTRRLRPQRPLRRQPRSSSQTFCFSRLYILPGLDSCFGTFLYRLLSSGLTVAAADKLHCRASCFWPA